MARALQDRGVEPGKVLMGGFDLVPEVLQQMEKGYVQALVDQQPYMQGFMPVMEVYLSKTVGLAPSDIDTGQGIVRDGPGRRDHGAVRARDALTLHLLPVLTGRRCRRQMRGGRDAQGLEPPASDLPSLSGGRMRGRRPRQGPSEEFL